MELPNGLKVFFVPDHKAPVVTVQVFYHAGAKDEPPGKRGIAHMFEHMMFKGSTHVPPEEHARFIQLVGGQNNAFTQDDTTGYHDTIPPSALDFTMKLEAERMRNLKLTQKTIDSERQVVEEELRLRVENNPIGKALKAELALAYTVHPYKVSAAGDKKDLDTVTPADCQKFYDEYYRPNNAALIVVGDTEESTVKALAEKYFGPLEKGPPVHHDAPQEPPQTRRARQDAGDAGAAAGDHRRLSHPGGRQSGSVRARGAAADPRRRRVVAAAPAPRAQGQDGGGGRRLRVRARRSGAVPHLRALPAEHGRRAKLKAALDDEIAKLATTKVEPRELQKAKNQLAAQAVYQRERVSGLASNIGVDWVVTHDPTRAVHQRRQVRRGHRRRRPARGQEVPRQDEPEHADAACRPSRRPREGRSDVTRAQSRRGVVVQLHPGGRRVDALAQAPAKTVPPAAQPTTLPPMGKTAAPKPASKDETDPWAGRTDLFIPPNITPTTKVNLGALTRSTTANGMQLITVPRRTDPVGGRDAGACASPTPPSRSTRPGWRSSSAAMLRKGTQKRTADQISDAVDFVGATLGAQAADGGIYVSCHARARDLALCLDILSDVAMNATFPESEMGEARDELLTTINGVKDNPEALASWHAANVFYGDDDPRGRPMSKKSVASITRPDLVAFRDKWFAPNNSDPRRLGRRRRAGAQADAAAKTFGTWKKHEVPPVIDVPPRPMPLSKKGLPVRLIDKPDATQTSLVVVGPGIRHADP